MANITLPPPPIDNDPEPKDDKAKDKLREFISKSSWATMKTWFYLLFKLLFGVSNDGTGNVTIAGNITVTGNETVGGTISVEGGLYLTPYAQRNRIINGGMQINQYSATVFTTGIGGYVPDRMFAENSLAGGQFTQSQGSITYNGVTYPSTHQVVNTAVANLSGANLWSGIVYRAEGYTTYDLAGQQVTVSFLFQANWSGTVSFVIRNAAGTVVWVQSFACVANVVQKVIFTAPAMPASVAGSSNNQESVQLWIGAENAGTFQGPVSSAWQTATYTVANGATQWGLTVGNTIDVAQWQMEVGPVNTSFEVKNIESIFIECMRFRQSVGSPCMRGVITTSTASARTGCNLFVPMRIAPIAVNLVGLSIYDGSTSSPITSVIANYATTFVVEYDLSCSGASFIVGRPAVLFQQGGSLAFSAEF